MFKKSLLFFLLTATIFLPSYSLGATNESAKDLMPAEATNFLEKARGYLNESVSLLKEKLIQAWQIIKESVVWQKINEKVNLDDLIVKIFNFIVAILKDIFEFLKGVLPKVN